MIQLKERENKKQLFREGVLGNIDLPEFIVLWAYTFPMDKLYREKHSIGFNSKQHRCLDPIDMIVELVEDLAINHAIQQELENKKDPQKTYFPGRGKYFKNKRKVSQVNQEEIDKAFDQIDIDDIKYDSEGNIIL